VQFLRLPDGEGFVDPGETFSSFDAVVPLIASQAIVACNASPV